MARRRGRPQDAFGKRARREGFPARSVYKLEEIDRRVRLFRPGQRVLDLGAAPGSWTLYAAGRVGAGGCVLGIDLAESRGALPPNAEIRVGDVRALRSDELGDAPFDVVISDMAPATTGQKHLDRYRSYELALCALDVAEQVLRPGGSFVAKIFQSGDFPAAKKRVVQAFDEVRIIRPKATRSESTEVFLVGLGRRAPAGG